MIEENDEKMIKDNLPLLMTRKQDLIEYNIECKSRMIFQTIEILKKVQFEDKNEVD